MVEGGPMSSAVYFNPVQVDMQWIRNVNKEERMLMDKIQEAGNNIGNNSSSMQNTSLVNPFLPKGIDPRNPFFIKQ